MDSFLKALRYCWPYRGRIVLAWLCAILGAGLWAGSLSVAGPLFSLLFQEPAKGIRLYPKAAPKIKAWGLFVPWNWKVTEDDSVATFEFADKAVRVRPGTPVIRNQNVNADQEGPAVLINEKYHAEPDGRAKPLEVDGDRVLIAPGIRVNTSIPEKELALEVSQNWTIVPDPSQDTFAVTGDSIRVHPRLPVVVREEGLRAMARQAEENHKIYAPIAVWLAEHLPERPYHTLLAIMAGVIVMTILRGAVTYVNEYLIGLATNRAMLALRLRVYDHVLRSPLDLYARVGPSDIMSRFQQDCFLIHEGMKTLLGKVFSEPIRIVFCLLPAIYIGATLDPWLPVIVLVVAPLIGYLVRRLAKLMRRSSRKALESWATLMSVLEESLFGIRVVKGYRLEAHERRKFFQGSRRLFKQILRGISIDAATGPLVETIFTVAVAGAIILGAKILLDRGLSAGSFEDLMIFFGLLAGILDPTRKLSNVSNRLQQGAAGAERVFELLRYKMEPRYGASGRDLPPHARSIEFRDVSFAYQEGKPVVRGVNLTVRHGEVLAIIGRTGCGKTTLVSLLPRFFEPTSGAILVDGMDTREVTLRSLREQIAIVPQESILFADTVASNISLGARDAHKNPPPREAVEAAARQAHADGFIRQLPQGYDTLIGEHGTTLSGGERQRLALARAIIRSPRILVLDEATSSLDEQTQALVQETLQEFVKGRTTLLIAHRLSTLTIAHRIAIMEAGQLVDVGTHEELLGRCDVYRRLRESGLGAM